MDLAVIAGCALLLGLVALVLTITDHLLLQSKIRSLSHDLSRTSKLLAQRGKLAAELAHEIKNPITAIVCSAETLDLLIGDSLHEDHRTSLRYMKEYGDSLLRLLGDFLDISRVEAGAVTPKPHDISVLPTLRSVAVLLRGLAFKHNVSISIDESSLDAKIRADPRLFKQIVFNLMHNAVKFCKPNGIVCVVVSREGATPCCSIQVGDEGPGIPPEQLKRIFNLYERYDHPSDSQDAGTGIGLALVQSLVTLSGGTITATSEIGRGSIFTLTLPLANAPTTRELPLRTMIGEPMKAPQVATSSAPQQSTDKCISEKNEILRVVEILDKRPLSGQQFLLVNETSANHEALALLIQAWGGIVDEVDAATLAVQALTEKKYDVVVIDDRIDLGDAQELARTARQDTFEGHTSIIVAASDRQREHCLDRVEPDSVIVKPLEPKTLLQSLLTAGKFPVS